MSRKNPYELLPDEYDLEDVNEKSPVLSPFYKGCLIVIAILVILSLLVTLLI